MLNQSTALRTEVGTRAFSAPETIPDDYEETFQYTNAVDMWSLGCVIYNVLAHSLPYQNSHAKRFPFPTQPLKDRVNDQGLNLLECLLRVDPSIRWTARKAAKHPWLEASCEASSAAVKDATKDANSVGQPSRPNESQNKRHHSDDQVDMPTVISSTEKTCPRPADRTKAPINQFAPQSSNRHGEISLGVDASTNSDGRRSTTSNMLISPPKHSISDPFADTGTETLKPRRGGYHMSTNISHDVHQNDTTKKSTASPRMPTVVSRALNFGPGTSDGSSNVADRGAIQRQPLMKAYHPSLAVRGRQESEEQGPGKMELVTIIRDLYKQLGDPAQIKIARTLEIIRKGVDLEVRNDGDTALHIAVSMCCMKGRGTYVQILNELLQRGADVDARTEYCQTALQMTTTYGFFNGAEDATEVAKQLIRYKADVNVKDCSSRTPLYYAALISPCGEFIDALLAAGAQVNALTQERNTALHAAAYNKHHGKIAAIKLILAGIDLWITNDVGMTALVLAHHEGNSGVVEAIEEAQNKRRQQSQDSRSHQSSHSSLASPRIEPEQLRVRLHNFCKIRCLILYAGTRQGARPFPFLSLDINGTTHIMLSFAFRNYELLYHLLVIQDSKDNMENLYTDHFLMQRKEIHSSKPNTNPKNPSALQPKHPIP